MSHWIDLQCRNKAILTHSGKSLDREIPRISRLSPFALASRTCSPLGSPYITGWERRRNEAAAHKWGVEMIISRAPRGALFLSLALSLALLDLLPHAPLRALLLHKIGTSCWKEQRGTVAVTLAVAYTVFSPGKIVLSFALRSFLSDSSFCELLKTATTIKKCTRRVEGDREDKAQKWHTKAAGQWRINWPIGKLLLCSTCRQNLPTCPSQPEQQDDLQPVPFVLLFGKIGNRSWHLLRLPRKVPVPVAIHTLTLISSLRIKSTVVYGTL